jgi:AAA15 family ATPase/GTPase
MGIIVKDMKLPDGDYTFISDDGSKGNVLKGLSKINLFVGENNSGKSRLLRSILRTGSFEFIPTNEDVKNVNYFIKNFKSELEDFYNKHGWVDVESSNTLIEDLHPIEFFKANTENIKPIKDIHEHFNYLSNRYASGKSIAYDTRNETKKVNELEGTELFELYDRYKRYLKDALENNYEFEKLYIPILRGLLPINYGDQVDYGAVMEKSEEEFDRDIYKDRILQDYPELEVNCDIFTGLKTYEFYTDYIGHEEDRKQDLIKDYKAILSGIFNEDVEITALTNNPEKKLISRFKIRIGEEKGREIHNLGDGVQSIIIMTFPLLINEYKAKDKNLLVFIEEPEQYYIQAGKEN